MLLQADEFHVPRTPEALAKYPVTIKVPGQLFRVKNYPEDTEHGRSLSCEIECYLLPRGIEAYYGPDAWRDDATHFCWATNYELPLKLLSGGQLGYHEQLTAEDVRVLLHSATSCRLWRAAAFVSGEDIASLQPAQAAFDDVAIATALVELGVARGCYRDAGTENDGLRLTELEGEPFHVNPKECDPKSADRLRWAASRAGLLTAQSVHAVTSTVLLTDGTWPGLEDARRWTDQLTCIMHGDWTVTTRNVVNGCALVTVEHSCRGLVGVAAVEAEVGDGQGPLGGFALAADGRTVTRFNHSLHTLPPAGDAGSERVYRLVRVGPLCVVVRCGGAEVDITAVFHE